MTWTTLPDTGARVLLDDRGVPRLVICDRDDDTRAVNLEIEVRTGWRIDTTTLTSRDDPRGWLMAVNWVGRIAVLCTYDEIKAAPVADYSGREPDIDVRRLTGMAGYSIIHRLREPWHGHTTGTYVVWASHPGSVGFVQEVGVHETLARLAFKSLTDGDGGTP